MPGTNRKMPKKMRGGGMAAKPMGMRGGGMAPKPKARPMKKGGAAVRSCSKKPL